LTWWCGGAIGRASDLRFISRKFEFCLGTIAQWPWASYLHLCASVTKQHNLVPVEGRLPCDWGVQDKSMDRVWVAGKTDTRPLLTSIVAVLHDSLLGVSLLSCMTDCWLSGFA